MDPKLASTVTTIIVYLAGGITAWAVQHGLVSADDAAKVTGALVTLAGVGGAGLLTLWKRRQHSQAAVIAQVNDSNNGLKVVSESSPGPRVSAPIIGPEAPSKF